MFVLLVVALMGGLAAQRPADIVKWSAEAPAEPVRAGGVAKVTLTANVEPGWKLYALTQPKGGPIPLAITIAKDSPFSIVGKNIGPPAPKRQKDEVFSLETQYYETEAKFTVPVTVGKTVAAGEQAVPVDVTFQACGQSICLRPFTQRVEVRVSVAK